ncbi:MAG: redox-regulated ATPase YchF [Methanosarcinaceae archaeon]
MGFQCGLVGLPNVGKSTIFNALTNLQVQASAYPFCTIAPNVGVVPVADPRLENIQKIIGSAKVTPTTLEFVDIAGLVKGASQGEGLGNQFLSHIQAMDVLAQVVRCFVDENVAHIDSELDAVRDVEIVNFEIILKDLEIVEKRLVKVNKNLRAGNPAVKTEYETLIHAREQLSRGRSLRELSLDAEQLSYLQAINLLTLIPMFYIANIDENHLEDNPWFTALQNYAAGQNRICLKFCGKAQAEIAQLDPESQAEFLEALGLDELGLTKIIRTGYDLLKLITFFTTNENEAHAWTITQETPVQKAAGKVHSDFETGFIKAEVIKYPMLIEMGSIQKLHEKGLIAIQGKNYIVQDGDLIFIKSQPKR